MKRPFFIYIVLIIIAGMALLYLSSSDMIRGNVTASISSLPTRHELRENFYTQRKLLLIYGASRPAYARQYRQLAEEYQRRSQRVTVTVKSDLQATTDDLKETAVFILGTPLSNRLLPELSGALPVKFHPQGFSFNQRVYRDSTDMLTLYYPNPVDPRCSVSVITGNNDAFLLASLQDNFVFWRMIGDYRIFHDHRCRVMGLFSQKAGSLWEFDAANYHDFKAETSIAGETPHYRFYLHRMKPGDIEWQQIARRQEATIQKVREFLGINQEIPSIDYHIYGNFEDKGLVTGETCLSHVDLPRNEIHTVVQPGIRGDDATRDVLLLARKYLGKPSREVLELGLSVYFSNNWRGKGYEYWASRLYLSDAMAELKELLNNECLSRESNLVTEPLAGSLVAFLIDKWGKEQFLADYLSWNPPAEDIARLEKDWKTYLAAQAARYAAQIRQDRAEFPVSRGFRKGFCHAQEGYQIYNGYLSRQSDRALEKLRDLNANAVSITPFSYMRDPHTPVFLPHSRNPGSENDESIVHAALSARKLGMTVMLKPHIWLGRSWPGEIEMRSEKDWDLFFDYYYRWMRHFALLAEMYHMEILCLGVELSGTTIGQEARWTALIEKIRKLYSGQLTYAANWGKEFENLRFWKELDFIGVNCYYPLSGNGRAGREQLMAGMKTVLRKLETVQRRYRKPLLLTEIGFTSTPSPWEQPHKKAGKQPVNLEHQAECYQVVLRSLYRKPWCGGIYWWKWPSYLEYGGVGNNDFTPNDKPAEKIVARWYAKEWK